MNFEWDDEKNKKNFKKHKVTFEDAIPVFFDERAISFEDTRFDYKDGQRLVIIGANESSVLYVAYAEIDDDVVRIISARPAEPPEIKLYKQG